MFCRSLKEPQRFEIPAKRSNGDDLCVRFSQADSIRNLLSEKTERKVVNTIASTKKFTHAAMCDQNGHIDREHDRPSNPDIDPTKTHLNYTFPMAYSGLRPFQYYKKRIRETYLYGRGTRREKEAITGCGWIVTLPKELYGNPEKEKAFFTGVYAFIANRYGPENIINNSVHYDEKGLPHIHVIFCPVTKLDHSVVQYKTKRTTQAIRLDSGRYEYRYIHVDKNGKALSEEEPESWIKLNNYARVSDQYDTKIDCNSVLNKIELRNFHPDLQEFLTKNGIEGKVMTGKTGTNFTVKELKEFTASTGMYLDEVKDRIPENRSLLETFIEKDSQVQVLSERLAERERELAKVNHRTAELERRLSELEKTLEVKQEALAHSEKRIQELEKEKTLETTSTGASGISSGWGTSQTASWGESSRSGWGSQSTRSDKEKTWEY